jgi:hypothetical protein
MMKVVPKWVLIIFNLKGVVMGCELLEVLQEAVANAQQLVMPLKIGRRARRVRHHAVEVLCEDLDLFQDALEGRMPI